VNWFAPLLVRNLFRRWREDWLRIPSDTRRGWWVDLGWGLLFVQLITLVLVWFTRRLEATGRLAGEGELILLLEERGPGSFNTAMWLDVFGNGFLLATVVFIAAGAAIRLGRPLISVTLVMGYATLFIPVFTGWIAWARLRPTLIADGLGSPGAGLSSFPSGHLVQTIVAFGLLAWFWARESGAWPERLLVAILFLAVVLVTAFARLRLGAHWPSDVVAALLIGFSWLAATIRAYHRADARAPAPAKTEVR
jgi:membrane-associated phospholipid phosphatase